jgi:predicted secreted protein
MLGDAPLLPKFVVDVRLVITNIGSGARVSWTTAAAIYFILWWVVLFAVLPWGVNSQAENGSIVPGSDPGAPAIPHLRAKLLWTTVIAALVFGAIAVIYSYELVTLEDLATLFGLLP